MIEAKDTSQIASDDVTLCHGIPPRKILFFLENLCAGRMIVSAVAGHAAKSTYAANQLHHRGRKRLRVLPAADCARRAAPRDERGGR